MAEGNLGDVTARLVLDISAWQQGLQQAQQQAQQFQQRLGQAMRLPDLERPAQGIATLSQSFTTLGSSIASVGVALLGLSSGTRVLEQLIQTGSQLQTLRVGLTTVAGSAEAGGQAFEVARSQAERLGLE